MASENIYTIAGNVTWSSTYTSHNSSMCFGAEIEEKYLQEVITCCHSMHK